MSETNIANQSSLSTRQSLAGISTLLLLGGAFLAGHGGMMELLYRMRGAVFLQLILSAGLPLLCLYLFKDIAKSAKATALVFLIITIPALTGIDSARFLPRLENTFLALGIFLAAFSSGTFLCQRLGLDKISLSGRFVAAFALGLGGLSLGTLLIGLAGRLNPVTITILLIITALCGLKGIPKLAGEAWQHRNHIWPRTRTGLLAMGMVFFMLWLSLPAVFLPPLDYDVTEYHAQLPRIYAEAEEVSFQPHNLFSGMPQNMEMLTTLTFVLKDAPRGWPAAKLLHWLFLPLLALAIMALGHRLGGEEAGWLGGLLLMASPLSAHLSGKLYVELGMCFYGLAALLVMVELYDKERPTTLPSLLAAGIMGGLAAGTKYPGLLFLAMPLVATAIILNLKNRVPFNAAVKNASPMLLGIMLALSPWLLHNLAATGNPIYPLWNLVLGAGGWGETLEHRFTLAHRAEDFSPTAIWHNLKIILFTGHRLYGTALLLLPVFIWSWPRPEAGKDNPGASSAEDLVWLKIIILWVALVVVLWFMLTHRLERFLYPAHVLAAGAVAGLWGRMPSSPLKTGISVLPFITVIIAAVAIFMGTYFPPSGTPDEPVLPGLAVAWGRQPPAANLRHDSAWRAGKVMEQLPGNSRILLLGEAAGFWLPPNASGAVVFNRHPLEEMLGASKSVAELADQFRRRGYTHLAINWSELARLHSTYADYLLFPREKQKLLREFLAAYGRETIPVSGWKSLPPPPLRLPPHIIDDYLFFTKKHNLPYTPAYPQPSYIRARPWLGAVAARENEPFPQSGQRLIALWLNWKTLMQPLTKNQIPPLGKYSYEIIKLHIPVS